MGDCPFCARLGSRDVRWESETAVAFVDAFPLGPGHTLVVPRRHVADALELGREEIADLWELVRRVRDDLARELHPDGWNIGLNVGAAGGQTVWHAHVHVIPRFGGDHPDPRGGMRCVLPDRARYWEK